ncbi:branched-chain amino acid transport system substrate-binding protein [Pseudoalteromonas citrea]|uniref:Branched-chain amino acid transport system substrate-binding protein n=2 Tax=Pseudoalteromonas citrea TaxID=43655 RepID=A0AAD4AEG7_9GAMM|nr:ABC transporter substrate-binding protein [Pseudoalteromonas citrea]KAF7764348.1 branched-chain amino acid transport system substrate-binding protein [Pseudoalteromonas citrea]
MTKSTLWLVLLAVLLSSYFVVAEPDKKIRIYHDSDYSNHNESALAMKMGFMTALAHVDHKVQGFNIEFVEKDHRGNSNRSLLHMRQFLKDPEALLVLGGLHSPPYIKNRTYINESEILLLVPWAAGGPITRYPNESNWVFRVSIDDTKAGYKMANFAVDKLACKTPHMLLERTPWGESNEKTMRKALSNRSFNKEELKVTWFNWNTQLNRSKIILRDIVNSPADCILFVGNAIEGQYFVNAMASLPKNLRLPIVSHWGITGGNFYHEVKNQLESHVSLNFIQSCFSFKHNPLTDEAMQVIKEAKALFPEHALDLKTLSAPAGFIHSYDFGKILIAALRQTPLTGNMKQDRKRLKSALENLQQPVNGLIKTYKTPFSQWEKTNPDAHEALGLDDICMASFDKWGGIDVLPNVLQESR